MKEAVESPGLFTWQTVLNEQGQHVNLPQDLNYT